MTPEQEKELWRWAVHNRAFELDSDLAELRSTFMALEEGRIGTFDKWTVAERQMRVCALELENLKTALGPADQITSRSERGVSWAEIQASGFTF